MKWIEQEETVLKKFFALLLAALLAILPTAACSEETDMLKIAIPGRDGDVIDYMMALMMLGAQPVTIWDEYDPAGFDGLLLPGGLDICPERYGQADVACGLTDAALDEVQFTAAARFIEAGIPVFGICRGHQLLNVYFGGTLIQDLPNAPEHTKLENTDNINATTADPDGFLAALYGTEFAVNSAHHQAIDTLAPGLRIVQWCGEVAEAMQHERLPVYGVQWHPERMCFDYAREDTVDGSKVLAWFLDVCRTHSAA